MTYAFIQDVPANAEMYEQVRKLIGDEAPEGLVSHVVVQREAGLRYIDVWNTQSDWEHFRDERVHPAVSQVLTSMGIPHDESLVAYEAIEVLDAWVGTSVRV